MSLQKLNKRPIGAANPRDRTPPYLALSHGQTKRVLTSMGYATGITDKTFDYYIKSLRKLGVPFGTPVSPRGQRQLALYDFHHLMELSLALTLRVYWTLPDAVLQGIVENRQALYQIYDTAYTDAVDGVGASIRITTKVGPPFTMCGVYLDPQIHYAGGRLLRMGTPKIVSPTEALKIYGTDFATSRAHLPINVSYLALRIVECAQDVPKVRPGPSSRLGRVGDA